jgi:hypothetical protein
MLIASRIAPLVAGIFGAGSGSHIVQVIIIIVVATAVIAYFVLHLRRGGSGLVRADAAVVNQRVHGGDGAEAASEATVRLVRMRTSFIGAPNQQWDIAIDSVVVGAVANNETVDVDVDPGHHTLRLGSGRHRSAIRSFDVAREEVVAFSCHGPRIWPMVLAALVNPNLWISLKRN